MKVTPRNGLPATNLYDRVRSPEELDTLYEVCEAEFNSSKTVHDQFERLRDTHRKFDRLFARYLIPMVQAVAAREELYMVDGLYPCSLVADRIAQDWMKK